MRSTWLLAAAFWLAAGCTAQSHKLPDESDYSANGTLLINTSDKLANEPDGDTLHKVALALQRNRTLACDDYNGECNSFAEFLNLAIKSTEKGRVSEADRKALREKAADIRIAVDKGRAKLRKEWESKK